MSSSRAPVAAVKLCLVLAACGGGGGGGDTKPPSPGAGSPPAVPAINYDGNSAAATVSKSTAPYFGWTVHWMHYVLLDEGQAIGGLWDGFEVGKGRDKQNGAISGTASARYDVRADGTGWIEIVYTNFRNDALTYNGRWAVVVRSIDEENGFNIDASRYFDGASVDDGQIVREYTGEVRRRRQAQSFASDWSETFTANLLVRIGGYPVWIRDARLAIAGSDATDSAVPEADLRGRLYDDVLGWLDVTTSETLRFPRRMETRLESGVLQATSGGARLEAGLVTRHFLSAGLDADGDGRPESAARLDLDPFFDDEYVPEPGTFLLAHAGNALEVPQGGTLTLDGRGSVERAETMLGFRWRLVDAPPGADAVVEAPTAPKTRLLASTPGTYRVELEVTDGPKAARDSVELILLPEEDSPEIVDIRFGMDRIVGAGQTVQVDARFEGSQSWWLFDKPGTSGADIAITNPNHPMASFLADVPGVYTAGPQGASPRRRMVFAANHPLWLDARGVRLEAHAEFGRSRAVALADINGNGSPELVRLGEHFDASGRRTYRVVARHRTSPGNSEDVYLFDAPLEGTISAGDLNGDGHSDLVVATDEQFLLHTQNSDGSFAAAAPLASGIVGCSGKRRTAIADLNGDGRLDLVAALRCGRDVEVHLQRADGTLAPPAVQALEQLPQTAWVFELLDLDGRQAADLFAATSSAIRWFRNAGDGTFLERAFYPGEGGFQTLAAGDIDGDGRPELVTIAGNGFELLVLGTSDDALVELKRLGATFGVSGPLVIDDLDGDGLNDVILVQPFRVQVLRNRGSLEFDPPVFLPLWGLQTPVDAFVADYDDDGRRDLLVIGDDAGMLAYFGR
jgi:hypothetical protein